MERRTAPDDTAAHLAAMATPRETLADWLILPEATGTPKASPQDDDDDDFFVTDPLERRRGYAIAEAEERGLWCFITRQSDDAWHALTRLERDAMADAINRAHRRR